MNDHMTRAVIVYLRKRGQMSPSKAAAHVVQTFGVSPDELAHALADERLQLVRAEQADDANGEES